MSDESKLSAGASSLDAEENGSAGAPLIKLVSKDGRDFAVERKYAFVSTLIKTSMEQDPSATEVALPAMKGDILAKVVEFLQHHKGVEPPTLEKPLRSKVMKELCKDPWDADYIDKIGEDRQALYDLILAANYMDIKSLLHLGCAKVASLIKGQPLERIKDILAKGTKTDSTATK